MLIRIPPRASANELGKANAIASAIVASFMVVSFFPQIGGNRAGTIKISFSVMETAKRPSLGYKRKRREHSSE
jgi:hypothetical protein